MPDMPLCKGRVIHGPASHVLHSKKPQLPYILNVHKAIRVPKHYITQSDSAHAGPLKVMGIQLPDPVSRL